MSQSPTSPSVSPDFIEVTAPVRLPGQSNAEAVFQWMLTNRYLWMLEGEFADRVETVLGTARLIRLAGLRLRWQRKQRDHRRHPAVAVPDDEADREYAFKRLARFLELHIDLDESFSGVGSEPRATS